MLYIIPGKAGRSWDDCEKIPGFRASHISSGDIDGDSYSDMALSYFAQRLASMGQYQGAEEALAEALYILWGGREGFHTKRKTNLVNDSGSNGMAADFDKDGLLDLAVSNHTVDGNHHAFSKIYYKDGNRFKNPRIEEISTHGPHWSHNEDMGHIYDRSWR